jgi:hypothetical protein
MTAHLVSKKGRLKFLYFGQIHPGNTLLAHELVGKMILGISPDKQLRWG